MQLADKWFIPVNLISFQLVWWTGVLMGNQALILSLALLVMHFLLSSHKRADWQLMWKLGLLGICLDAMLIWTGFFVFPATPWWLLLLWLHFSLTLAASLGFLRAFPVWVAGALGAVFGPFSYLAGAHFYAVALPYGDWLTASVLGLIWALLLPFGVLLAKGHQQPQLQRGRA